MENVIMEVPQGHHAERAYACRTFFRDMLGIDVRVIPNAELTGYYSLKWKECEIRFKDAFFGRFDKDGAYLDKANLPVSVLQVKNGHLPEKDLPVIFGNEGLEEHSGRIDCGIDVPASVFFLLTRWEEAVIDDKDYLERFPAQSSLAVRAGFIHRPLVDEMSVMVRNMIRKLDPAAHIPGAQHYELVFTHDIDLLNAPVTLKEFAKDVVRRKSLSALARRFSYLVKRENPYDIIDHFMDVSEHNGTLSRFYIMTGHNLPGRDGENYNITPLYQDMLGRIKRRGHVIGFHPSLFTYKDQSMFNKEKAQLERDIDGAVDEGRQHALRFEMPTTWGIWESAGMRMDSTLGYSAREGFRCGTGREYTVFDVVKREELKLREKPLLVMDNTLHVNRKMSLDESAEAIRGLMDTGKRYDMPVTILVHNLIKDRIDWTGWFDLYNQLFYAGKN